MAAGTFCAILQHLHRVAAQNPGRPTDAELLERFSVARDPAAFEVLLWRHGPMVLNLCRRLLRHEQDAEDAFQPTFLTLVRKAGAIAKREAVGSWLYKVAYRVALEANARNRERSARETTGVEWLAAKPVCDATDCEHEQASNGESGSGLTERYRAGGGLRSRHVVALSKKCGLIPRADWVAPSGARVLPHSRTDVPPAVIVA